MNQSASPQREDSSASASSNGGATGTPVTDSPWLWIALFATAGIVSLVVARGQVDQRQVRIERQTQGRQRAAEMATEGEALTDMSTRGDTVISLEPLLMLLAVAVLLASALFWIWRIRQWRLAAVAHAGSERSPPEPSSGSSAT